MVLGPYRGLVWSRTLKTWKTNGFTVFSLKNVKKSLVLLCFRSNMLENHWFYCVFAHKCSKTIGFIVFSWLVRSKTLKNHWFYSVFLTFQAKQWKKPLVLLWKILKMSKNHYKTCGFLRKKLVKPIPAYGFGPWFTNTRLDKLWGTLTAKLFREQ